MQPFDTIVIGGGIVGAAAARALAIGNSADHRKGQDILLVDALDAGHTRGSSHGDGRIVRFTYPEAAYLEMAKSAFNDWANIERDSGVRLIETTGGWECGPSGSPEIADLVSGMGQAGIAFERLTGKQSLDRFPYFQVEEDRDVLYQSDGAIVRADRAVETLWSLVKSSGAKVAPYHRVEHIEAHDGGSERLLRVSGRRDDQSPFQFECRNVVLTAGGWSRDLLASLDLALPLKSTREVVGYFPVRTESEVDHRVGQMPTLIDYDGDVVFYALPQIDVPGVKVGWHHAGPETDANELGELDAAVLDGIVAYVKRRFPHLVPEPVQVSTCLYTNTPDYHFVVDRHPQIPEIVIGTGFSGHGFKFGPVLGEILAQLATGSEPHLDLSLFGLDRLLQGNWTPRTSA